MTTIETKEQVLCKVTVDIIPTRHATMTEDGQYVSTSIYHAAMMEHKKGILTLKEVKEAYKLIKTLEKTIMKFIMYCIETKGNDTLREKLKYEIGQQMAYTRTTYKKELSSITRSEHLYLLQLYPLEHLKWNSDYPSQSEILALLSQYSLLFSYTNTVQPSLADSILDSNI